MRNYSRRIHKSIFNDLQFLYSCVPLGECRVIEPGAKGRWREERRSFGGGYFI